MTKNSTQTAASSDFRYCQCSCALMVSGKTIYKPGHDARHVSQICSEAHNLLQGGQITTLGQWNKQVDLYLESLPSVALRTKAHAALVRVREKFMGKTAKPAAIKASAASALDPAGADWIDGEPIKVGRWTYPTRTDGNVVLRNTQRDGSGFWVEFD